MKVKFGALVSAMTGTVGGQTIQRSQHGTILRTKPIPRKSRSSAQSYNRTNFAVVSQAWRDLTQANRDSWDAVAVNWSAFDSFGDPITLSGYEVFVRASFGLVSFGGAIVPTGSNPLTLWSPGSISLTISVAAASIVVGWSGGSVASDNIVAVAFSRPLPPSRKFRAGSMRGFAAITSATTAPVEFQSSYISAYGLFPPLNSRVYVSFKVVSTVNGSYSQVYSNSTIVVP